jgi:ribosomal protein L11 methyltransferase
VSTIKNPNFTQIELGVPFYLGEAVSNLAWEEGTLGIEEIFQSGEHPETLRYKIFFPEQDGGSRFLARLSELSEATDAQFTKTIEMICDPGWRSAWKDSFKPILIGRFFRIHPPWIKETIPGRIDIEIYPGQSFGTGNHETTSLCLQLLESVDLTGRHFLDAGCGTGILAIAGLLRGVRSAVGLDMDPLCVTDFKENLARNKCSSGSLIINGTPACVKSESFDVITANLDVSTLDTFAQDLGRIVRSGGTVIASGYLNQQERTIEALFLKYGLRLIRHVRVVEWTASLFQKQ